MKHRAARAQRGVSSLMLIALVVLLGGLTAHAVALVTASTSDSGRAIAHARVVQAAESGLEWGRFRALATPAPLCAAAQSINTLPGTMQPYTVTVRCTASAPVLEGGVARRSFRLTATACSQPAGGACPNAAPGADYVERTAGAVVVR